MFGKIVGISVLSLVVMHIYNLYNALEFSKVVKNKGPRDCYNVPEIKYGAETITVIKEKEVAIVSSGMNPRLPSNIFLVKLDKLESLKAEPFLFELSFDKNAFHPHGITVRQSREGPFYLYVINHHNDFECVDVFEMDLQKVTLKHIKRIIDPLITNLNAIVVLDDFKFYGTNWLSGRNDGINFLHMFLMLPVGYIVYYDGKTATVPVKNLFIPNGVAISPNSKFIYVGLSGSKAVVVYKRHADNTLEFLKQYDALSLVDNVEYSVGEGSTPDQLYFAGPYVMSISAQRLNGVNPNAIVPSYFSRFTVEADGSLTNLEELFIDDGNLINMSAHVTKYKNYYLVGTFDTHMVVCKADK